MWRFSDNFTEIYVQAPMKGEPYRRITPAALARNAPPQSGLRPASSTFLGGCQKSMSLRTSDRRHWCGSPPVGWKQLSFAAKMFGNPGDCARRKYPWGTTPACALVRNDRAFSNSPLTPFAARRTARRGSFFSYYCRLVMLSLDFYFFFHILFKTCEKESLYHQSIAFLCACFTRQSKKLHRTFTVCGVFPSTPFLKRFQPLLWHLKTSLSLAFSGISPQAIQTLWKHFCSRGGGVENRKGAERRFFPVFGPFEVDFLLFSQAATGFPHDLSTAVETAVDKFTDL